MTFLRAFGNDRRGVAAVEAALIGGFLVVAMFNVAEVSRYAYISMQVLTASQAGAQAAIITCDPPETPVTINCPEAPAAIAAAITGTSLGAAVALQGGLAEGWYCVNLEGVLQRMGGPTAKPVNCTAAGVPGGAPSLYLSLRVAYPFEPIFPGLTLVETFPRTIVKSAMMRML